MYLISPQWIPIDKQKKQFFVKMLKKIYLLWKFVLNKIILIYLIRKKNKWKIVISHWNELK